MIRYFIAFLLPFVFACTGHKADHAGTENKDPSGEMLFDQEKWSIKEGADYPYRENMLHDVVYNDTIRTLNSTEILDLLGAPDRRNENYLYYRIVQKRLGLWPVKTKTMVIKLAEDDTVEWIKIHG